MPKDQTDLAYLPTIQEDWKCEYGAVYTQSGIRIALADREEPRTLPTQRDANVRLIATVPAMLRAQRAAIRLCEKVKRANDLQHSGGSVSAEDWNELYHLESEVRELIRQAQPRQ